MRAGRRHAALLPVLVLAGLLLCLGPVWADERPGLPFSQVVAELSKDPDFMAAVYTRLGRDPKAGGILGPDDIKRLRELILGKDFEALDRFPGLTVRGMGRSVRLAAATLSRSADNSPVQPEEAKLSVDDELGIPAAGAAPTPDTYLRQVGFGLEAGAGQTVSRWPAPCRGAEPPLTECTGR